MSTRYKGSVMSSTAATNSNSAAIGIWRSNEVMQGLKASAWPSSIVTDPYFNYVTVLLRGDGTNGAQNNTFLDSSTNNFSIVRNGNATQGTFTPYGDNWGNYFNGTADYFFAPANAAFAFGTGSWTVEAWVYVTTLQTLLLFDTRSSASTAGIGCTIFSDGKLYYSGSANTALTTTAITANSWNHVAWVYNGTTLTGYINGVSGGTATPAFNITQNNGYVGRTGFSSSAFMPGYVSNLRVVKGTAVYTTTFTPSTTPLTAISGTSLLTCKSNRFIDNSSNAFALTISGSPSIQRFSPFSPSAEYSASVIGGSGYFTRASSQYLSVSNNTGGQFSFGTGAFTIECWIYLSSMPSGTGYPASFWMFGGGTTNSDTGIDFYINNTQIGFNLVTFVTATAIGNHGMSVGKWYHVAVVRGGTSNQTVSIYVNGTRVATASSVVATADAAATGIAICAAEPSGATLGNFDGYISNYRIVKGTAVYSPTSSTLTVPTVPLTAITNTSLLCNFTNAGIYDSAEMNNLETVGNAQISTTVVKVGIGSMAFDGTGDWLTAIDTPNLQMGSGDFTIEGWVYLNAIDVAYGIISKGTSSTGISVNITSGNKLQFSYTASNLTGATSLAASTWYYFAVVRSGTATGNLQIYLNGSVDATSGGAVTDNFNQTSILYVGASRTGTTALNGYIDDLRVTKGYARTITIPTAAFPAQ